MDSLSVILPVYNEAQIIEIVIKEWRKVLNKARLNFELIICEDGSNDGTKSLLQKITPKYRLILNQVNYRRGYGQAVIDGITTAKKNFILCVDSDGQCDPRDFPKFWARRYQQDALIGWRKHRADSQQRKIFSRLFKTIFLLLFPTLIHDPSAPYVLFRKRKIYPYLKYLRFLKEGFWWGFIGMCVKKGLCVAELPIYHRRRLAGDTQVYHLKKIPSIAIRNLFGLIKLKFSV